MQMNTAREMVRHGASSAHSGVASDTEEAVSGHLGVDAVIGWIGVLGSLIAVAVEIAERLGVV